MCVSLNSGITSKVILTTAQANAGLPDCVIVTEAEPGPDTREIRLKVFTNGIEESDVHAELCPALQWLGLRFPSWMAGVRVDEDSGDIVVGLYDAAGEESIERLLDAVPYLMSPNGSVPVYSLRAGEKLVLVPVTQQADANYDHVYFTLPAVGYAINHIGGDLEVLLKDFNVESVDAWWIDEAWRVDVRITPGELRPKLYRRLVPAVLTAFGARFRQATGYPIVFKPAPNPDS